MTTTETFDGRLELYVGEALQIRCNRCGLQLAMAIVPRENENGTDSVFINSCPCCQSFALVSLPVYLSKKERRLCHKLRGSESAEQ